MKIDKTIKEYLEKYGDESMASLAWSVLWRAWVLMFAVGVVFGILSVIFE